jgi:hypothetical protein
MITTSRTAAREFVDGLMAKARDTQRAIEASYAQGIPVGEARELDPSELMPFERAALFGDDWADRGAWAATAPGALL